MCKCNNKHPNMLSTILGGLKRKFPEYKFIVEEMVSSDINDFNNPLYLDKGVIVSWFFGNIQSNEYNNLGFYFEGQSLDIEKYGVKDILFDTLDAEVSFLFYGWSIRVEGAKPELPESQLMYYLANLAEDGCAPGNENVHPENPVEVWEFEGEWYLNEAMTILLSESEYPAILSYKEYYSDGDFEIVPYMCR